MTVVIRCVHALLGTALILFSLSCTRFPSDMEARHHPIKISNEVSQGPGSVSWSPDGTQIAFIARKLMLYDRKQEAKKTLPIENAYWSLWTTTNELLVLSGSGRKVLSLVDPAVGVTREYGLDGDPVAAYRAHDGRLTVLSVETSPLSFGTKVRVEITVLPGPGQSPRTIHSIEKIYPSRNVDRHILTAWSHAGLNPLDETLLVMEHISPPVVNRHTKLHIVDPVLGTVTEARTPEKKSYISAAWSPDGTRLALTDEEGLLELLDSGTTRQVDLSSPGFFPAWNPKGSLLSLGGTVVEPGSRSERLLPDAPMSLSWWSPDGRALAIADHHTLWLLDGFDPSFLPPDRALDKEIRDKISLLKVLYSDGLITLDDYASRRKILLHGREVVP